VVTDLAAPGANFFQQHCFFGVRLLFCEIFLFFRNGPMLLKNQWDVWQRWDTISY